MDEIIIKGNAKFYIEKIVDILGNLVHFKVRSIFLYYETEYFDSIIELEKFLDDWIEYNSKGGNL